MRPARACGAATYSRGVSVFAMIRGSIWSLCMIFSCFPALARASEETKAALRIFRDECIRCHKPGKEKGGLLLHDHGKMLAGGDSGEVVVPGNAGESLLLQLVREDGDPHMPPKNQLSGGEIESLEKWIEQGAAWDESVFDELPPAREVTLGTMHGSYQPVLAIALSPDESRLAVARANGVVLLDLTQEERPVVARLAEHLEPVQSLVWTPDGTHLIAGGFQRIVVWDVATNETRWVEAPLIGPVTAMAVGGDGPALFAADGEIGGAGFVHEFGIPSGEHRATWKAHDDTIYAMNLSPDGSRLLTGSADKLVKLWELESREQAAVFEGHTNHVLAVAFDHDGGRIASAGADQEIKLWDLDSTEQIISIGTRKSTYVGLDWIDAGKSLVAITENGSGSIYTEFKVHEGTESSTGAKEKALISAGKELTGVRATADGKRIFAGGFDGNVHEWDGKTGRIHALIPLQKESPDP